MAAATPAAPAPPAFPKSSTRDQNFKNSALKLIADEHFGNRCFDVELNEYLQCSDLLHNCCLLQTVHKQNCRVEISFQMDPSVLRPSFQAQGQHLQASVDGALLSD